MTDTKLIANLFDRLNQNQLALGAAVEELSSWVEQRGSAEIANNVRGALETLDENLVLFARVLLSWPSPAVWGRRDAG